MIYQHPLAYLLGLEGLALLRGWAGDFDEAFVHARLAEVRRLVADEALASHPGVAVARADLEDGYRPWAASYDEGLPRNGLFDLDEAVVGSILDSLGEGTGRRAVDAACGTARLSSLLVGRGWDVVGVDVSPSMLAVAVERLPTATFAPGSLEALPVPSGEADVVVCGLALTHVAYLAPAYAELARVVRPGGAVVVSDTHEELVFRGSVVKAPGPAGEPGFVPTFRHSTGDHLRAALAAGLAPRRCEEPGSDPGGGPARDGDADGAVVDTSLVGSWADWPWSLLGVVPAAARAAWGTPSLTVWHFERAQ